MPSTGEETPFKVLPIPWVAPYQPVPQLEIPGQIVIPIIRRNRAPGVGHVDLADEAGVIQ